MALFKLITNVARQAAKKYTFPLKNIVPVASFQTSAVKCDLMEFFDDKKNWGAHEIKVGRAWKMDEMRIKSNSDLHKLWFVLLKERNMLLTMAAECEERGRLMPNEERIDKVEESMNNLEEVVRERNKAYHELETGRNGERVVQMRKNQIAMPFTYRFQEHLIPKFMNTKWKKKHIHRYDPKETREFLSKLREKRRTKINQEYRKSLRQAQMTVRNFPNVNLDHLQKEFPDVNLRKVVFSKRARGNYQPKEIVELPK